MAHIWGGGPKIRVPFLEVPIIRTTMQHLGSVVGCPYLGKLQYLMRVLHQSLIPEHRAGMGRFSQLLQFPKL